MIIVQILSVYLSNFPYYSMNGNSRERDINMAPHERSCFCYSSSIMLLKKISFSTAEELLELMKTKENTIFQKM